MDPKPRAGVLYKKTMCGHRNADTQRDEAAEGRGRAWNEAAASQPTQRTTTGSLGGGMRQFPPPSLRKEPSLSTPRSETPALRDCERAHACALTHMVCGASLRQPQQTDTRTPAASLAEGA